MRKSETDPDEHSKWPIKQLEQTFGVVSRAAASRKSGYGPRWTFQLAYLVDVYRSEIFKMRATDNYNLDLKLKAMRAGQRGGRDTDVDED